MTTTGITVVIALAGVIVSVICSTFVVGARYGRMEQTITTINDRLAKIEGMFTLTLKQEDRK